MVSPGWTSSTSAFGRPRRHRREVRKKVGSRTYLQDFEWSARPGEAGEPKNVAGGASPGPPRPMDGPDALRAVHARSPGKERG